MAASFVDVGAALEHAHSLANVMRAKYCIVDGGEKPFKVISQDEALQTNSQSFETISPVIMVKNSPDDGGLSYERSNGQNGKG
jgi:hypothetical protein